MRLISLSSTTTALYLVLDEDQSTRDEVKELRQEAHNWYMLRRKNEAYSTLFRNQPELTEER